MNTKIFVNLPVKNLDASKEFFGKLGYRFNPQFTDGTAACMIISEDIFAMLLTHEKFLQFSPKPICDTSKSLEALLCLSCASRSEVDELVRKAVAAGGHTHEGPTDYGFMYSHGFLDLDGHAWELIYMNPSHVQPAQA